MVFCRNLLTKMVATHDSDLAYTQIKKTGIILRVSDIERLYTEIEVTFCDSFARLPRMSSGAQFLILVLAYLYNHSPCYMELYDASLSNLGWRLGFRSPGIPNHNTLALAFDVRAVFDSDKDSPSSQSRTL